MTEHERIDKVIDAVLEDSTIICWSEKDDVAADIRDLKTVSDIINEREKTKAEIKRLEAEVAKYEQEINSLKINTYVTVGKAVGELVIAGVGVYLGYRRCREVLATVFDFESHGGLLTSQVSKKFVERYSVLDKIK